MKQQLNQEEIDEYFGQAAKGPPAADTAAVAPFDFRRLDRIPKAHLNALHFLHEQFTRSLTSSLSIYLRSDVSGNLTGVEQLLHADVADSMPSPTCILYLSMQPYDGHCMVEINQCLLAPLVDLVLGGTGNTKTDPAREITDVERDILDGLFRIIAHNLADTWKQLVPVNFAVDAVDTKPQMSKRISRTEAVVAIAMELHVGETVGMVNLVIPALTLKMMRPRFDRQSTTQRAGCAQTERAIRQRLTKELKLTVELELRGAHISLADLLNAEVGNVISLGVSSPLTISVNGAPKFQGQLVNANGRVGAAIA